MDAQVQGVGCSNGGGEVPLEAPPRTLDVRQFAKARSSELLSLYGLLKRPCNELDQPQPLSTIAPALPRHLRRRTSSYNRRRPLPGLYRKKRKAPASLLPRKHRKVDSQTSDDVSTHVVDVSRSDESKRPLKKRLCRRLRRRLEFKAGRCVVANDGTRRLATHLWHAKRFSMIKRWGYYLPLGRPGRGHGSRAVLKWSKDAALLQDATFYSAMQLHGPQVLLLRVLQYVLLSSLANDSCDRGNQLELSGACFGRAILHHGGSSSDKVIAPILWAWKPVLSEPCNSLLDRQPEDMEERDILLWVHAAAYEEAFQCLQAACHKVNEDAGSVLACCFSRTGDFGRIDLLGLKSFNILQEVIFPVQRRVQKGSTSEVMKLSGLVLPIELPRNAVINMEVLDPRLRQDEQSILLSSFPQLNGESDHKLFKRSEEKSSEAVKLETGSGHVVNENDQMEQVTLGIDPDVKSEALMENASNQQAIDTLWSCVHSDFCGKLRSPVNEKFLSGMRHINRLGCYGLIDEAASKNRLSGKRKALTGRCICPIMLLKHDNQKLSACGWSIILPSSWISVFWITLVLAGGRAIGMRERHWLLTDAGLPCFPYDYPDSPAYADHITTESMGHAKVSFKNANKKMPNPLSIFTHLSGNSHKKEGANISPEPLSVISRSDAVAQIELDASACFANKSNLWFIARTVPRLGMFLQRSCERGLLLFPAQMQTMERFKPLSARLQEGQVAWHLRSVPVTDKFYKTEDTCYLQVCLCPFHKGIIDVGAMVFAPTSGDYNFWLSTRNHYKKQHMNLRYGSGQTSPNHYSSQKPIGFVTSGAPRGSKSNSSIGFCDAAVLGQIRARQWVETNWNNDRQIFVMTCNDGLNTYRPAFASIALEDGPDIL